MCDYGNRYVCETICLNNLSTVYMVSSQMNCQLRIPGSIRVLEFNGLSPFKTIALILEDDALSTNINAV